MNNLGYRRVALFGPAVLFLLLGLLRETARAVWLGLAVVFFVLGILRARSST